MLLPFVREDDWAKKAKEEDGPKKAQRNEEDAAKKEPLTRQRISKKFVCLVFVSLGVTFIYR